MPWFFPWHVFAFSWLLSCPFFLVQVQSRLIMLINSVVDESEMPKQAIFSGNIWSKHDPRIIKEIIDRVNRPK